MATTASNKIICVTAAAVTGLIALSAYAGTVGLLGGGISFGDTIDTRLPFDSLILAGLALLAIVAVPMTVAAVAAAKGTQNSPDLVFAAGLLLVVWIGVELAFIKAYSWFHPTYLAAAVVVLGLGWLMDRHGSTPTRRAADGDHAAEGGPSSLPQSRSLSRGRGTDLLTSDFTRFG